MKDTTSTGHLTKDDQALIVAFLDGELEEGESHDFAKRLSREPELAAALESFAEVDFAQRRTDRVGTTPTFRRILYPWFPLAAAAALLVALGIWRQTPPESGPRVAIIEAAESLEDYGELHGIDGIPVALRDGGSDAVGEQQLRDLVERVKEVETEKAHEALDSQRREVARSYFAISFESPTDCSAILVRIAPPQVPSPKVKRLYPPIPRFDPDAAPDLRRFEGGRVHILHDAIFPPPTPKSEGLRPDPGFHIPFTNCGSDFATNRMPVVLGLREAPITKDLLEKLDEYLAELDPEVGFAPGAQDGVVGEVEGWLVERGFGVTRLVAEE
jgi:hypothetical protein